MKLFTPLFWFEEKAGIASDAVEAAIERLWLRCAPQARIRKALTEAVRRENQQ